MGFTRCAECDAALVYRLPMDPPHCSEPEAELVVIHTDNNTFNLDLARTTLDATGIDSIIRSDDYGGRGPHLSFIRGIELLVRSDDAVEADEILSLDLR